MLFRSDFDVTIVYEGNIETQDVLLPACITDIMKAISPNSTLPANGNTLRVAAST